MRKLISRKWENIFHVNRAFENFYTLTIWVKLLPGICDTFAAAILFFFFCNKVVIILNRLLLTTHNILHIIIIIFLFLCTISRTACVNEQNRMKKKKETVIREFDDVIWSATRERRFNCNEHSDGNFNAKNNNNLKDKSVREKRATKTYPKRIRMRTRMYHACES